MHHPQHYSSWIWHVDVMLAKINGETHHLWRAVDRKGEVLETYVSRNRNKREDMACLKKTMNRSGNPRVIVYGKLKPYRTAFKDLGLAPE